MRVSQMTHYDELECVAFGGGRNTDDRLRYDGGPKQRRYDTVDLYSGVSSNDLLRLAFQARDQIAAFLSSCTVAA